jgi:hypothetical protein
MCRGAATVMEQMNNAGGTFNTGSINVTVKPTCVPRDGVPVTTVDVPVEFVRLRPVMGGSSTHA